MDSRLSTNLKKIGQFFHVIFFYLILSPLFLGLWLQIQWTACYCRTCHWWSAFAPTPVSELHFGYLLSTCVQAPCSLRHSLCCVLSNHFLFQILDFSFGYRSELVIPICLLIPYQPFLRFLASPWAQKLLWSVRLTVPISGSSRRCFLLISKIWSWGALLFSLLHMLLTVTQLFGGAYTGLGTWRNSCTVTEECLPFSPDWGPLPRLYPEVRRRSLGLLREVDGNWGTNLLSLLWV